MNPKTETYASIDDFFAAHQELDRADVKKHYSKGKCELWYPVIAQDGRPHLRHAVVPKSA